MPGKQLVVDACVVRSAGTASEAPQSTCCREALAAIRQHVDHRLVFNTALRLEWQTHASQFSTSFLAHMTMKRRVTFVPDDSYAGVLRGCAHTFEVPEAKAAFLKDAHILSAALITDHMIISIEVRLYQQLIHLALHSPEIAELIWINPYSEGGACADWILAGAHAREEQKIGKKATP